MRFDSDVVDVVPWMFDINFEHGQGDGAAFPFNFILIQWFATQSREHILECIRAESQKLLINRRHIGTDALALFELLTGRRQIQQASVIFFNN
jgi:hypothetical protein